MSLEQSIQNLADAINALARSNTVAAVRAEVAMQDVATPDVAPAKRGPGRPKKETTESAPVDAPPPQSAAVVVPAGAPASATEPVAPAGAAPVTKSDVQKALIAVVQKVSKEACISLCERFGASNLSGIDADVYPELLAAANELLGSINS